MAGNKKLLLGLSGLFTILLSNNVFAGALDKFGEFIFVDLAGAETYAFKFLLWIILFATINLGISRIEAFKGKTAAIISFAFSLGAVIMMKDSWVMSIFTTFSHVIAIIIALTAPMIGFYANHTWWTDENSKFHGIMRGVTYLLIGYSFGMVLRTLKLAVASAGTLPGTASAIGMIVPFAELGLYLCFFLGGWHIISNFIGGGATGGRETAESVRDFFSSGKNPEEKDKEKKLKNAQRMWKGRSGKRVINNFVADKKEKEKIKSVKKEYEEFFNSVEGIKKSGKINSVKAEKLVNDFQNLKQKLSNSINYLNKVQNRATFREQSGIKKILHELQRIDKGTQEIEAFESQILKLHEEASRRLESAMDYLESSKIEENLDNIKATCERTGRDLEVTPAARGNEPRIILTGLNNIKTAVANNNLIKQIQEAENYEEEAIETLEGLMIQVEKELEI